MWPVLLFDLLASTAAGQPGPDPAVKEAATTATGQCGYAIPDIGQACAYVDDGATCGDGYARRTVNTDGVETGCVCAQREQGCGPCRALTDCASYSCVGYDYLNPSVVGTCDPVLPIGEYCYTDSSAPCL